MRERKRDEVKTFRKGPNQTVRVWNAGNLVVCTDLTQTLLSELLKTAMENKGFGCNIRCRAGVYVSLCSKMHHSALIYNVLLFHKWHY